MKIPMPAALAAIIVAILGAAIVGNWATDKAPHQTSPIANPVAIAPQPQTRPTDTPQIIQSPGTPPPPLLNVVENQRVPVRRPRAVAATRNAAPAADSSDLAQTFPVQPSTPRQNSTNARPTTSEVAPGESGQVWVNSKSGVYHRAGMRWYGKTKAGYYAREADAIAQGFRAAQR